MYKDYFEPKFDWFNMRKMWSLNSYGCLIQVVAWVDLETSQWSIYEGKCTSDNNDLLHIPDLILKLYAFYTFFYWSYFPYDGIFLKRAQNFIFMG
jgi:hypothetical protein